MPRYAGPTFVFLAFFWPLPADARAPLPLAVGKVLEGVLEEGGVARYAFELKGGSAWRLDLEQHGIDLRIDVLDSRKRRLLAVDTPFGREGTESLLIEPTVARTLVVEIRAARGLRSAGRFRIGLEDLPAGTNREPTRIQAEREESEAGRLWAEATSVAKSQARARLDKALEIWRILGDRFREARASLWLGRVLEELDSPRLALPYLDRAAELYRQVGELNDLAFSLDSLGAAHFRLGESARAVALLEEALELRVQLGMSEQENATRLRLGLVYQRQGRWAEARACYEKSLARVRELGDRELEAQALNNLGGISSNLGEPTQALDLTRQALEKQVALGDRAGQAATLNNLGSLHRGLGELDEARLFFGRAAALFEELGDRFWQARALNNLAAAYLSLGELERARSYLLRALTLRRQVADRAGEAVTLRNLGWTSARLGEVGKAEAFYRKALERCHELGDRRGQISSRKLLGELFLDRRESALARVELESALADVRELKKPAEEAEIQERLSRLELMEGRTAQALDLARRAHAGYRATKNPLGQVAALLTWARVERTRQRPEAALEQLTEALSLLEALHGRLGDPAQKASFLATRREAFELWIDSLMARHRLDPAGGFDRQALVASERARSRSLLAVLDTAKSKSPNAIENALFESLRAAERRLMAKTRGQIEAAENGSLERIQSAEQDYFAALAEHESIQAEIRRRNPRATALRDPEILDVAGISAQLDRGTLLLEFFLGEERSYLWSVAGTEISVFELPPRAVIEAQVEQVAEQIGRARRPELLRKALDTLGSTLFGRLGDRLSAQRLAIVPDGALHSLAFAALTSPRSSAPLLVDHEIVVLPSVSVLAAQRRFLPDSAASPAEGVAIYADPIFERRDPRVKGLPEDSQSAAEAVGPRFSNLGAWGRLPQSRREAEAIAALLPADEVLLALDAEARVERVLVDPLERARILHFATHGFVHPRNPELSGLVLSRWDRTGRPLAGFLGQHHVASLRLSADLVVLSGCETAAGKNLRGEGVIGLGRAFMLAGVPRVITSLWQVRDQATADLMTDLYTAILQRGLRPAAALREAQLSLRQQRRTRDPAYWAAFALQGDWR